ncbi:MAG TPA: M14 family zinc carboxypeptidase [Blastocatellia bacterium]|nr:M14 family zinc carboxypeptidase [Blastocatellia bacterium]
MRFCRSIRHWLAPIGILIVSICPPVSAQQKQTQQMDEDFAKSVKEWTTRPEFISPLVDHLPKVAGVPSPKDALGYHIGTPRKLTRTAEIYKYYRELASRSPRVKVINIGQTDEGRECLVVVVADEETVKNIDTYRRYLAQLSDPRQITEAQAQEIIAKAKPIYHLMGGLHSAETGPPEMLMELTYRLAVEDSPIINAIRDNVIITITPVAEPDGRDRYVDWYYRHKIDETGEQDSMGGPPYWGKYIYHDNNRDINYSQVTMRNLLEWYLQWRPPIMHDLHESVPFMYTFSGQAPQQPALDPILYGELPWFSNFEMSQMIKYGMPGVWTHGFVDMWSPGYLAFMSSNHNGMIRMYETFGNGGANTMKRKVAQPAESGGAGQTSRDQTSREWYRPSPPYKEVEWSMRNNTNFMQTGVLSALQLTSQFPKVVLENFYKKSRNSIEDGITNAPFGFVIPPQADQTRITTLVNLLRLQGIEVGRLKAELKLKEGTFAPGSFVIKRDQPYGRLAKILLEKQNFPDSNLRTYDDTGWTMGLMLHTNVVESADKAILDAQTEFVDKEEYRGNVPAAYTGPPPVAYLIVNHGSNNLITLRYRLKDLKVQAIERPYKFPLSEVEVPGGSLIIPLDQQHGDVHRLLSQAIRPLGLRASLINKLPDAPMHEVDLPRLAVYSTWGATQEVGWVRHALDKFEVNYDLIYKERVKQGNLRDAYDVIVIPNQGRSGKGLVFDREPQRKPLAYTKSDQFKSHGIYGESEDITGGMGLQGALEFQKFVEAGGLLVTLGQASFFPPEFGLTRKIDSGRPSPQFYAPGPIVEAEILQPSHPIFYGYAQKTIPVRYANGPLLTVPEPDREQQVLMRFPGSDKSVLSGLMRGVAETRNRPAIVDVPTGKGRVIIFATNPCYRWQNHGEFAMLFNTIMHHNDIKIIEKKQAQTAEVK